MGSRVDVKPLASEDESLYSKSNCNYYKNVSIVSQKGHKKVYAASYIIFSYVLYSVCPSCIIKNIQGNKFASSKILTTNPNQAENAF